MKWRSCSCSLENAVIPQSPVHLAADDFDNDVGAIAALASFVIRPRFPLPKRAPVAVSPYDLHTAPVLAHEMLGEEPGMEVRAGVATVGAS